MTDPEVLRRVVVIGCSGSGKSTLARRLAGILDAPHVELDALNWLPCWTEQSLPELRRRVAERVLEERSIVDGNYRHRVADLVWPRATAFVWLDYSFPVVLGRIVRRTFRRSVGRDVLWAGNRESFRRSFLSRDSILLWMIRTHGPYRREYSAVFAERAHAPSEYLRLRRPAEADQLIAALERTT